VSTVRCLAISATAAAAVAFFMGVPAATAPPSTPAAEDAEIGMPFITGDPRIGRTEATMRNRTTGNQSRS
jgi:hypothetical protein